MIHDRLGQTVLNYRKKNKMTIREFADYAGISTSLISQIERGHANPSLSVLELIAKALNVPLFTLFINEIDTDSLISKKKDRKKVYRENNDHIVYDVLTPDFMKGEVYVELEGKEYFLEEGDVVRIPPNVKHRFLNKSDESNHILFVLTPSLG